MKKILGGLLAVTVLTGIMGLHSAEAAPHLKSHPEYVWNILSSGRDHRQSVSSASI